MTKYSISDCIVLPLRDFAKDTLETTDDRILLWQSANDLAKTILDTLKKHGYTIN